PTSSCPLHGLGDAMAQDWEGLGTPTARWVYRCARIHGSYGTPFSVFYSTNSLNGDAGFGIPRYVPSGPVASTAVGSPVPIQANDFAVLTLPAGASTAFNPALAGPDLPNGVGDFGPFPASMSARNGFVGPGAWNFDLAIGKSFAVTE